MIILACLFAVILLLLLLNIYYVRVVRYNDQEEYIKRGSKKVNAYDAAAFGSSYCRYAFIFEKSGVRGYNFGIVAQFLYYTDLMIRSFRKTYRNNSIIIIVLPDLVFADPGNGKYEANRYVRFVEKSLLKNEYSPWRRILLSYFPLFIPNLGNLKLCIKRIFFHKGSDEYSELRHNRLSENEVIAAAEQRCKDWCNEFHLKDTLSDEIPEELYAKFEESTAILTSTIDYCLKEKLRPVLLVTPVSNIMRGKLSKQFLEKVLYSNICKANVQNIPFLDYFNDERFADIGLYANNADFLNARGRELFTDVVLADIKNFYD